MFRWRAASLALVILLPSLAWAEPFRAFPQPLDVGPFSLTERNGQTVTRQDLRGKVWVAHFFYCTCAQGCAQTTATMARLQTALAEHKDALLVSIHLYPEEEDLALLRDYAQAHGADAKRWLFLTGDPGTVEEVVTKSFFLPIEKAKEKKPGDMVAHSFALMLIDAEGGIRGYVDGRDPTAVEELTEQARSLLPGTTFRERARAILPGLNASLNGLCTLLLLVGYVSIRKRRERLHNVCMLGALAVSVVFLTSYLYYHFAVLEGQPTRFQGEGWIRPVYFAILGSHTVLAAVVAPLALVTVYRGLRDRRDTHRRLARWTFPLWLYVSVTGVVVYVLLYHLYPSG
jgi:protein SCO1/2